MKEAAEGQSFLAMAGFEVNEILSAMPAMLDLAGAGQLELGAAADIASNILSGFGMEADQAGHMANVLAKAASSANTDVSQLGEAMVYLAPSANALGWKIEESAAAVQVFSDAGIQGSMAGRAFATSLQRLAKPTSAMSSKMEELGIEFFDAEGNMKPLTEVVGDLENSFEGLTAEQQANALTTLFGAEAFKHWSTLVEKGSSDLTKMEDALINSEGAAKKMRETMEDNLHGDWAKFISALQEMALVVYTAVAPALRELLQYLTKVVEWIANLSPETQKMIVLFVGFLAILGPIILILGKFAMAIGSIITLGSKFFAIFSGGAKILGTLTGAASKGAGVFARFLPMIGRFATMIPRLFNPIGLAITAFLIVWNLILKAFGIDTKEALSLLWSAIKDAAVWIGEALMTLGSKIVEGLGWLIEKAVELFGRLIEWIIEKAAQFVQFHIDTWNAIIEIISNFIANAIELIIQFVLDIIEWFVTLFNRVVEIIKFMNDAAYRGFRLMVDNAIQAAKDIVKAIVGGFQKAWKGAMEFVNKAATLGLDFAKGIAKGIRNGSKLLKDAVVAIGKAALRSFTDFFKIKSPSRLMADEAKWLPGGVAKGILDNVGMVGNAMRKFGGTIKNGYDAILDNLPAMPSMANILPQPRRVAFEGVNNSTTSNRTSDERDRGGGDVNVYVRKTEDASTQTIQNKVERNFFKKARQRE